MRPRTLILAIALAALALAGMGTAQAQGPTEVVIEVFAPPGVTIPVRSTPSLSAPILRGYGNGNRLAWNGQVVLADGRNWMAVSAGSVTGWMSPDNDQVYVADPTKITMGIDRSTVISPYTNPMTLYTAPGRGNESAVQLPVGTALRVTDAPVVTDLYTWWPVSLDNGARGWVVDTGHELQVQRGLSVYGIPVCSNFNLKAFGAPGWDSVRSVFPTTIGAAERIVCLASTRMRGDNQPVVVVLTRTEDPNGPFDTLRLFEQQGNTWRIIFMQASETFSVTDRLSLHDFGDGVPFLMWNIRNDGTGQVLQVNLLRYLNGAVAPAVSVTAYKGQVQVNPTGFTVYEADYLPNEGNCCPSGVRRMAYGYQNGLFVPLVNDVLPHPGAFQVRK